MANETLVKTHTHTKIQRDPPDADVQSHVRIYGEMPGRVALQIRSHGIMSSHGKVSKSAYSHASLDLDQAKGVRDALDAWIKEQEG